MTFENLGLGAKTLSGVTEAGYTIPTPIQEKVIPLVLERKDVFGCAQTGTGKTASYTLPLLDVLEKGRARARMPRILVLAPTRELAQQVNESFVSYGKHHRFKSTLTIGGESIYEQEKKLTLGADIVIATPGRLLDLIVRGKLLLMAVEVLVIDEADRMLDMGFIPDIEKIVALLPRNRQTLMFSATVPQEIRKLSQTFLNNPVEVTISPTTTSAETVEQFSIKVSEKDKRKALHTVLVKEKVESAIIFCNRKKDIATLCTFLKKHQYNCAAIHGDLHQSKRTETLEAFKRGEIAFLVASDVAARGIDVADLPYVFNFDVPTNAEEYVHRVGRTGRAGKSGKAFTFVTENDVNTLRSVEKLLGKKIQDYVLDEVMIQPIETEPEKAPKSRRRTHKKAEKPAVQKPVPVKKAAPEKKEVVGFGEAMPSFMKNYFPNIAPGLQAGTPREKKSS